MTASKVFLAVIPATTMIVVVVFMPGIEHWLAALGKTAQAQLMLGRIGLALPYATGAAIGTIFLFAANGAAGIKAAGWGVVSGSGVAILIALLREGVRLAGIAGDIPKGQSVLGYAAPRRCLAHRQRSSPAS
jgi:type IV secretion system protein VirD4